MKQRVRAEFGVGFVRSVARLGYGQRLYELTRGIDEIPVVPNRPAQSVSAADKLEQDVLLAETEPMIRRLSEKMRAGSRKKSRIARTVVLKSKTAKFHVLTRS
jgi:DNA polymerase-4